MFWKRGKRAKTTYDKSGKVPVIRSSICTGEQVAGFRDEASGRFQELMLIRTDSDYREFLRLYEVEESEVRREW